MTSEITSYTSQLRRARYRLAVGVVVVAVALILCARASIAVPWWLLFLLLLSLAVGGVAFPPFYRLRHHPRRGEPAERRYALAQLLGRPVGFALVIAGALAVTMHTARAEAIAPYLFLPGVILASLSIFFRYKGWDEEVTR